MDARTRGSASVPAQPNCDRKNCDQPGSYRVGVTFRSIYGGPLARGTSGLRLCKPHCDELTIDDLMTPEGIEKLQQGLAAIGKAPADPASLKLVFERGN